MCTGAAPPAQHPQPVLMLQICCYAQNYKLYFELLTYVSFFKGVKILTVAPMPCCFARCI